ncbi:MAG: leucyl-tRNA---protein transferase [Acidobacteriota bacterium]|jgi:arginine-tRNA-protein transferase|nr:leucyl-tRNA---protein transferase [Acidobacteriota bacterium]
MSSPEEYFLCWSADARRMDELWAKGWRHFGPVFFRYRRWHYIGRDYTVTPLRIDLGRFTRSRSQRRVVARNRDLRVEVRPTEIDAEMERMFRRHRLRFHEQVPDSLDNFLSYSPATVPCCNETVRVYSGTRLVAAHFLDIGEEATSAVYAMFDPDESRRSLGIYTMLLAIEQTRRTGRRYYYPGYATREPSPYDYKKNFAGLEQFDWRGRWLPLTPGDTT